MSARPPSTGTALSGVISAAASLLGHELALARVELRLMLRRLIRAAVLAVLVVVLLLVAIFVLAQAGVAGLQAWGWGPIWSPVLMGLGLLLLAVLLALLMLRSLQGLQAPGLVANLAVDLQALRRAPDPQTPQTEVEENSHGG